MEFTVYDDSNNFAKDKTAVIVRPAISFGTLCYFYYSGANIPLYVPLPHSLRESPRPELMIEPPDINLADFHRFTFAHSSFAL